MKTITSDEWGLIDEALNEFAEVLEDIDDENNYTKKDLKTIYAKSKSLRLLSEKLERIRPTDRTKIIICAEGGVVTGAYSTDKSETTDVEIWDWDDKIEAAEDFETDLSEVFDELTKDIQLIY
jgi:uncharacterized protein (UPF0335 family)